MFSSAVRLRPAKTQPKTPREYDYVLEQKTMQIAAKKSFTKRQLNISGITQTVHRSVCKINERDVILNDLKPLLVRKSNVTETLKRHGCLSEEDARAATRKLDPPIRVVYFAWRDLSEHPNFTQRLHDIRTSQGRRVTLTVRVTGYPDCEVRWSKDNRPMSLHRPENVEVHQFSKELFVLFICGAKPADQGVYTCTAFNRAGSVTTSAYLRVEPYSGPFLPVRLSRFCPKVLWL